MSRPPQVNDLAAIYARITQRLDAVGLSASAASRLAGKPDAIRNLKRAIEDGRARAGVSTATIAAIAPVLQTTSAWLLDGSDDDTPPEAARPPHLARVIGKTQAGAWTEFDDIGDHAQAVPAIPGRFPAALQMAYEVVGSSMTRAHIFDGNFVVCVPYFVARGIITPDDIVVVERRRGGERERTVKQIEVHDDRFELWPRSDDPRHQEPIVVEKNHWKDDGMEIEVIGLVIATIAVMT